MATKNKTVTNSLPKEPKKICQNKDCNAMGRYQPTSNFYKSRNAYIGYHPYCKDCIKQVINIDNMETIYEILQTLDTPFIQDIWREALASVDGDYIETYLNLINSTYKTRYENARFKDSIYEDSTHIERDEDGKEIKEWNDEWQGYYSKREIDYLNKYYQDLNNDFKIITTNHKDYARRIAQASLIMNDTYNFMRDNPEDKDAVSAYNTAVSNFDRLSKSAQFAESQRSASDVSLGCFGRVFDAVEKHNFVPQHIPEDKDMFDKIIDQFMNINKSL